MQNSLPRGRNRASIVHDSHSSHANFYEASSEISQMARLLSAINTTVDHISRRSGDVISGLVKLLLQKVAGEDIIEDLEQDQSPLSFVLAQLPSTIRSTLSNTSLEGRTTEYAVCPTCHYTYGLGVDQESGRAMYPAKCSNTPFPGANVCESQIVSESNVPVKTFLYYEFRDFLSSLYLRPDLEEMLDNSADIFQAAYASGEDFDSMDMITDIFQGTFFSSLEAPATGAPFLAGQQEESRLVFSLHVDFFTFNGTSCGTIAMACLNIPIDMRYRAENVYLAGIIPGPKEPSLTQLNHYIRPLVDDLVVAFNSGIYLRSTSLHPSGRLIRCAIGPIVCDLPAGRKLLQIGSYTSDHFCSSCTLLYKNNLGRTDYPWLERNPAEMRLAAEQWRTASSKKEAAFIFKAFGVRFSELWRLPYINPVKQLVVDPTHCLLQGVVPKHFEEVLKLKASALQLEDPQAAVLRQLRTFPDNAVGWSENDKRHIGEIQKILIEHVSDEDSTLFTKLMRRNLKPLAFVCGDLNIRPQSQGRILKQDWAKALQEWRTRSIDEYSAEGISISMIMARIRAISRNSISPSWLKSGRSTQNFGHVLTGTLKVHEWKQLCTLYIPMALISLWGVATDHSSPSTARNLQVLNHTMSLVAAVRIVGLCYTNKDCADRYLEKITEYVRDLCVLHPETSHVPNHHMAIHIYDFLRLFGPAESWCTYPFERMIGHLQSARTNSDLEHSILKTYVRTGKLHRWLGRPGNSQAIHKVKELFDKFIPPSFTASTSDAMSGADSESSWVSNGVPSDLRALVGSRSVKLMHPTHVKNNVIYANSRTHPGNSQILFQPLGDVAQPIPGLIKYIYQLQNDDWRYAVQPILPCRAGDVDPYAIYDDFPAKRYSGEMGALMIIDPSWIKSQFLLWKEDEINVVIIPINPLDL